MLVSESSKVRIGLNFSAMTAYPLIYRRVAAGSIPLLKLLKLGVCWSLAVESCRESLNIHSGKFGGGQITVEFTSVVTATEPNLLLPTVETRRAMRDLVNYLLT